MKHTVSFSSDDLLNLMDGHEPPTAPVVHDEKILLSLTDDEIAAVTRRYHYRSVLFDRVLEVYGEDELNVATLLQGWPGDWSVLDKWGSRLNSFACHDTAPKWLKTLRGR